MNHPIPLAALLLFLPLHHASADDSSWFCRDGASEKRGSVLLACGVDTDATENGARKKALAAAFEELDAVCDRSADCKQFELDIDPERSECLQQDGGYKCYRALRATITQTKRSDSYVRGETLKRALERVEITVKTDVNLKGDGKSGIDSVSAPSCEADVKPLSDALLDLSTEAKRDRVQAEAVKVPFSVGCLRVHDRLLSILTRNKIVLPGYTSFLLTALDGIPNPSEDNRAELALRYFRSMGQMPDREWKTSIGVIERAHATWYMFPHVFYPEAEDESQKVIERKRVDALFSAVQHGEFGKPVTQNADQVIVEIIRASAGYANERKNWLGIYAYLRFRPALTFSDHPDHVADALMSLSKQGDDDKSRKLVGDCLGELARKAPAGRELSQALERYIEELDESAKKQDDEEDSGEHQIALLKSLKSAFITEAGPALGKNLAFTYDDYDRRNRTVFCLKNGISCPDLVPDTERLTKLLRSKKTAKRVEALELLRWMPKVASTLEEDLLSNLGDAAEAGVDAGEYIGNVNSEALHVIAALPQPSAGVYRRLIELDISVNDREDLQKLGPGWEPHLLAALKSTNPRLRATAARNLGNFARLSPTTCAFLSKDTKGREPTAYNDFNAQLDRKCKKSGGSHEAGWDE